MNEAPPSPEQFDRAEELRDTIRRLTADLAKAKRNEAEYVAAVYRAAKDAMAGLSIPAVPRPAKRRNSKREEVAVPLVSDLQLHKVTSDYNSAVCAERMKRYAQK